MKLYTKMTYNDILYRALKTKTLSDKCFYINTISLQQLKGYFDQKSDFFS